MNQDDSWRDRYLSLAEKVDADGQRAEEAERELLRLIARLCVACQGLDEMLDPHLKRLRKATRDGTEGSLLDQAQAFGDALMQVQDERPRGSLFGRLLQHSGLASGDLHRGLNLWRELAKAPAQANDEQLDELAGLLFANASDKSSCGASGGGLLGRLIKRGGGQTPNRLLRELIEATAWPDAMQSEVQDLRASLDGAADADAWIEVVRRIGRLAAKAFEQVNQDTEAAELFLAQLSERLQAFDQFVARDSDRRRASRESGTRLDQAVSDAVGGLSVDLRTAADLDAVRVQVLDVFDRVQQQVAGHIREEAERGQQAEQQIGVLQQQLQDQQRETFDLRRRVAETRHQAMSDPLTGLPNRRAFEERAAQEVARWKRFGEPLGLIVWDVDDFKHINDVFGHKAGDRALALIGRILRESLRETDFIARFGGEEFVALLIGAEPGDALKVAEVMRRNIENAGMHSHKKPVQITLSGGLAMLQADETIEQLFERADKAMYQAKKAGKNQVLVAS